MGINETLRYIRKHPDNKNTARYLEKKKVGWASNLQRHLNSLYKGGDLGKNISGEMHPFLKTLDVDNLKEETKKSKSYMNALNELVDYSKAAALTASRNRADTLRKGWTFAVITWSIALFVGLIGFLYA